MDKFILIISFVVIASAGYSISHFRAEKRKKRMLEIIRNDWELIKDNNSDLSYINEIISYQRIKTESYEIDDITWNDFEMDHVFDKINYTYSTMGEVYLYKMLRNPTNNIEILHERDRVIEYFLNNGEERIVKQYKLNNIGKFNRTPIEVYIERIDYLPQVNIIPHIIMPFIVIISIIVIAQIPSIGIVFFFISMIISLLLYYWTNKTIERYLPLIMQIGGMLNSIKEMNDMKDKEELRKYSKTLEKTAVLSKKYRRYFRLFNSITLGSEPDIDTIYDSFIKPILHIDIIVYQKLINLIKRNINLLLEAYETVGFLDSMISIAAFRYKLVNVRGFGLCKPDLTKQKLHYCAEDLYNPLLLEPVSNSINTEQSVLITGSNATGKSTFLRTIGINAILAQSIYTVCGKSYSAPMYWIMSSMSIKDNIMNGESYYMKEIKALKRILDRMNGELPILCCIDEVLRGTNTIERIAAASKILENISKGNVLCFVASHDLELTYILEEYYKNYHFQESVDDEGIVCDFKLYEDRSYTRNAINLLKFLGYSKDIIDDAKKRVDHYLDSGMWT